MADYISPGEDRKRCVQAMGEDLGQVYYDLFRELVWLHYKWEQYCELFGKDQQRVELLNKVAPRFFGYLQHTLFDDIQLHLARLTDPPQTGSGKNQNLTMRRFTQLIADPKFKSEVEKLLEEVEQKCEFARQWRNKVLAHLDVNTRAKPQLLPPRTRKQVKDALEAMRHLMNSIAKHYGLAEFFYEMIPKVGDAATLVHRLEKCLQKEKQERLLLRKRLQRSN
jgi:hypothetical protein